MAARGLPRNIAPPSLPLPPLDYSAAHQNLLTSGIQQFGARTANAVNDLLANTQTPAYTVGTLPSVASSIGKMAYVTDGAPAITWGVAVSGGGTSKYLVWCNGSNWTVVGQ